MKRTTIKEEYQKGISMQGEIIKTHPFPDVDKYILVDGDKVIRIKHFIFSDKKGGFCDLALYMQGKNTFFNDIELYDDKGKFYITYFESDVKNEYIENIFEEEIFINFYKEVYVSEEILKLNKVSLFNLAQSDLFSGWGWDFQEKLQNL